MREVILNGKEYTVQKSTRKNKEWMVEVNGKTVHYGDPTMKEYPGTSRGDNYCARSYGIGKKYNLLGDITSPNTWSRKDLWDCKGKKSKRS